MKVLGRQVRDQVYYYLGGRQWEENPDIPQEWGDRINALGEDAKIQIIELIAKGPENCRTYLLSMEDPQSEGLSDEMQNNCGVTLASQFAEVNGLDENDWNIAPGWVKEGGIAVLAAVMAVWVFKTFSAGHGSSSVSADPCSEAGCPFLVDGRVGRRGRRGWLRWFAPQWTTGEIGEECYEEKKLQNQRDPKPWDFTSLSETDLLRSLRKKSKAKRAELEKRWKKENKDVRADL